MTTQTLEEIEDDVWPDPPPDATRLVRSVHALRRVPVGQMSAEDLRVVLLQRIGSAVLVPPALDLLEHDPLTEGDLYPGDLLSAVLHQPAEFWQDHPDQAARLDEVLTALRRDDDIVGDSLWASLTDDVTAYRARRR